MAVTDDNGPDVDTGSQTHEGCVCGHGLHHHRAGTWPSTPVNGPCAERGCDCSEFRSPGKGKVLCAHADRNGVGAHWKLEGEPCDG